MSKHNCLYYHSLEDLCNVAAGFLQDGIKKNELCVWIIPDGLGVEAAKAALRETLKDLDKHVETGQLEIREPREWYTPSGEFNPKETLNAWAQKERQALDRGFSAVCAIGDGSWFPEKDKEKLVAYECSAAEAISRSKLSALCTYSTEKFSHEEMKIISKHHGATLSNILGKLTIFK